MREDDKKQIQRVKEFIDYFHSGSINYNKVNFNEICDIEGVLDLIEKQQKEIENSVSKNKVREKLKELKQEGSYFSNGYYDSGAKLILEELLEE